MKKLLILFVLTYSFAFGQNSNASDLTNTVKNYLTKAQSAKNIITLQKILGEDQFFYYNEFAYIPSINPLNPKNQKRVSSVFGNRFHPIDSKVKAHLGIDISAKAGTPIHAAAKGIITKTVKSNLGYGNQVVIKHNFGFSTRYAHMYLFIVKEGQKVTKGEIIGFVGNTGKSTGNHIHFEIIKNNTRIDPYPFFSLDL